MVIDVNDFCCVAGIYEGTYDIPYPINDGNWTLEVHAFVSFTFDEWSQILSNFYAS